MNSMWCATTGRICTSRPATSTPQSDAAIRILRTDPTSATATRGGLDSARQIRRCVLGMYVADGRLFLVTSEAYFRSVRRHLDHGVRVGARRNSPSQVYDVRDPAHPRKLMSATIDGVFVESRRIGDRVVLVSRHAPRAMLDEDAAA